MKHLGFAIRIAALALLVGAAIATPGVASAPSLLAWLTTVSFLGCVAVGMTFITLSGNKMSFASVRPSRSRPSPSCTC